VVSITPRLAFVLSGGHWLILLAVIGLSGCASWPEENGGQSSSSSGGGWLNWSGPVVDSREVASRGVLNWPDGPEERGPSRPDVSVESEVLAAAIEMKGRPYRLGASGPRAFDCSGLVHYAYRQAGINVPRTTSRQFREARHVDRDQMRQGDVIFFAVDGISISHVAIYAGAGEFIHSPSPGSRVSRANLNDGYWSSRFAGVGRFQ